MRSPNKVYAYKHDGSFHRLWVDLKLLKETKDYYIFLNPANSFVYEKNDYTWRTKESAVIYFSKNHWFNIIMMFKEGRIVYYCNLATPPVQEMDSLKYIDYELDVKYFTDTKDRLLLDQNEYNYYKKKYAYPNWLLNKIEAEKKLLFTWIDHETGPFSQQFRDEYAKYDVVKPRKFKKQKFQKQNTNKKKGDNQ